MSPSQIETASRGECVRRNNYCSRSQNDHTDARDFVTRECTRRATLNLPDGSETRYGPKQHDALLTEYYNAFDMGNKNSNPIILCRNKRWDYKEEWCRNKPDECK